MKTLVEYDTEDLVIELYRREVGISLSPAEKAALKVIAAWESATRTVIDNQAKKQLVACILLGFTPRIGQ